MTAKKITAAEKAIKKAMTSPTIIKLNEDLKAAIKQSKKPDMKALRAAAKRGNEEAAAREAAKSVDHLKAAREAKKADKTAADAGAPVTPLTQLLTKVGFVHAESRPAEEGYTAHGYTHSDGSAALFVHENSNTAIGARWTLKRADGTQLDGKTAKQLAEALHKPAVAAHVLAAIELLNKLSKGTYRLSDFAGDANYKARIQLLKRILGTDKVLVKQSGVNAVIKAFYTALKVPAASAAAMASDFENKCIQLSKQDRKTDRVVKQVEQAEIANVMKAVVRQRKAIHDDKPILPAAKRLNAKQRRAADETATADLAAQIARKRRQEEYTPIAVPRPDAEVDMDLNNICLLEDPNNGIVLMCLEKPNSQGAICVYNNGSRVAVGVVPTEVLVTLRPLVSQDLISDVNQLLHPITAGVLVTPQAEQQLTAVLTYCKENIKMTDATVQTKKFAAPAGVAKKTAAKKAAKAAKPAKAAKAKVEKTPRVVEDRKIKALVTLKSEGLPREGSFCYGQVESIIGSKTVSEAQAKLDKSKLNPNGRKLEVAWLVKQGYLQVA